MYFDASNLPNKCEIIDMHFSQSKIATYFIFCKEFFVPSGLITTAYKKITWWDTDPGLMCSGHQNMAGVLKPPSKVVCFPHKNGPLLPAFRVL